MLIFRLTRKLPEYADAYSGSYWKIREELFSGLDVDLSVECYSVLSVRIVIRIVVLE